MAKKSPKHSQDLLPEDSIFSDQPARTAQERQALEKQEKRAKKEEKRQQNRELRAALRAQVTPSRDTRRATAILLGLIGVVVLVVVLLLALQIGTSHGRDIKEGSSYYVNTGDLPEAGEEGISASINEVHYTENGGMYLYLTFLNVEATPQHPVRIQVKLLSEAGEVIAAASHSAIPKSYYVTDHGYESYELYIPKKYVQIADDPLTSFTYDVLVNSEEYTESAE